jgi:CcmD family protein
MPMETQVLYVAGAYAALWLGVIVYVVILTNQVAKIRKEIRLLADEVAKKA